ncbi:helix-turn-helix domain-containing protein [Fundicoccus culcitae]|uniref:Helix-turn-helix domain-containing protein n=1 Tax=Fundicoccus culcitae TaxID=2969821 RepID=A0ABY5P8S9_9LACT|nr:Rgg/GadR/MutR family transcriptional regulator [Fundicoccus culcitae]UUX34934.1 helix-turn-helix domain-containing protein [Fundicoccus culcitae]
MHYGRLLKRFRESKKITQAQLVDESITPQFLSKYENGKSDIKLSTFLILLDRLNVSIAEFNTELRGLEPSPQSKFLKELNQAKHSKNKIFLRDLIKQQKQLSSKSQNPRYQHNIILANQMVCYISNQPYDSEQAEVISNYLKSVEHWGIYELTLFGNSIFFFNTVQLNSFVSIILSKTNKYSAALRQKDEFAKIMLNMINFCLFNDEIETSESLFVKLESILKGKRYFYQENQLNYLYGIYYIQMNEVSKGKEYCDKAIEILIHFKDYDSANAKQEELDKLLESIGFYSNLSIT